MHELVPDVPLRHGHAISIDMAYSATLAHLRGLINDSEYNRILGLFSRAGLSMDHHQFDEDILDKGTKAILKTRDGKLRAAIPAPLGNCIFLNDVSEDELFRALRRHKEVMKSYPRNGEGLEAFVDASDTGYTVNNKPAETNGFAHTNGSDMNGRTTNGVANGVGKVDGLNVKDATKHASGPEGVDGLLNGGVNGLPK